MGNLSYWLIPHLRKRILSNLTLAKELSFTKKELFTIARKSLQHLCITCLEYPYLHRKKGDVDQIIQTDHQQIAHNLQNNPQGVVFFCAHQANWELPFLKLSQYVPGIALARPFRNRPLFNWLKGIREAHLGRIVPPKDALKESSKALKNKQFLGVVSDQAYPASAYSAPFFGRRAYTSCICALIACKNKVPLRVVSSYREKGKQIICVSDPILPNKEKSLKAQVKSMMDEVMIQLQKSIRNHPEQWMWLHNKWKQPTPQKLKRDFRHESILIILPSHTKDFDHWHSKIQLFHTYFPNHFISILLPDHFKGDLPIEEAEKIYYSNEKELFLQDFRFKQVFDFSGVSGISNHYKKLCALQVTTLPKLCKKFKVKEPELRARFEEYFSKLVLHAAR